MKKLVSIRSLSYIVFSSLAVGLIVYIIICNIAPFGIELTLAKGIDSKLSDLGPKKRVEDVIVSGIKMQYITDDLTYFTTEMPFNFDSATVRVTFKNDSEDQELFLGFKDQEEWHYDSKTIDSPFLNSISWNSVGDNPILYQKENTYKSTADFFSNIPQNKIIGTYNYDQDVFKLNKLNGYSPSKTDTVINTPLRGKQILYAYLDHEPFKMSIEKQDLNWYDDPDVMTVYVYKDKDIVLTGTLDDDGITDSSGKVLPPQILTLKNPGPDLPESGVYKIVIDAPYDSVIKKITTNLHKVVFEGSLNPVANKTIYPKIVESTVPTTLFSNALIISAVTYHLPTLQTIKIDDQLLKLTRVRQEEAISSPSLLSKITIPENDVTIKGQLGYFAFKQEQFFKPLPYYVIPVKDKSDVELCDYVLTDYKPSVKEGDWRVATADFNLSRAVKINNKLSWLFKAPHIKENGGHILIKDIQIILKKDPIINL